MIKQTPFTASIVVFHLLDSRFFSRMNLTVTVVPLEKKRKSRARLAFYELTLVQKVKNIGHRTGASETGKVKLA